MRKYFHPEQTRLPHFSLAILPTVDALVDKSFVWFRMAVEAGLIFFVFYVISRIVSRLFADIAAKASDGKRDVICLLGKAIVISILVLGAVTALGTINVNITALVTGLGLTGFALGLAFKDVLSNLLAGALILFYRPFSRGARINVSNFEGVVTSIDFRYTVLKAEGKRFLIPNSTLLSNVIIITEEDNH